MVFLSLSFEVRGLRRMTGNFVRCGSEGTCVDVEARDNTPSARTACQEGSSRARCAPRGLGDATKLDVKLAIKRS